MDGEHEPALPPAALLVLHGEVRDLRSAALAIAAERERAKPRPPVATPPPPVPTVPRRRVVTFGPLPILRA